MKKENTQFIKTLDELAESVDYSFMNNLHCDPDAKADGSNHTPRQVFTGHYVPVTPTPIENPEYITHSKTLFKELGFADSMATSEEFIRMFSADLSNVPKPMKKLGWATGYALSIYGNEYYEQCPFKTGNGYGDGRAISILEAVLNGKRWEMQLKGSGQTPYSRGADGRAVLRSSIREFLAQEHMYSLGVPTTRSLSLFTSKTQEVERAWYSEASHSKDPDMMVSEAVAISTRVAPSFLRVGQIELFARRARKDEHPNAMEELEKIVLHLIDREYSECIDQNFPLAEKIVLLAQEFRSRLTSLVTNWVRVGYCQGNFNSDNCAAGGFTLDYGPFGFMELFDPEYQPWTGGGSHFAFLNQHNSAERNFHVFCLALKPLLVEKDHKYLVKLREIHAKFLLEIQEKMERMWASKLGLDRYNDTLFKELEKLMIETSVDYTIFFRELSNIPNDIETLKNSFYSHLLSPSLEQRWSAWLKQWKELISNKTKEELTQQMKSINPKYTLREWHLVPAYQQATKGDYTLLKELQEIMTDPYAEQSKEVEGKYYRLKPSELFEIGGISHVSCSS